MSARFALVACALGLLFAAGCGPAKLNETRTVSLDSGDTKAVDLPAQKKAQKITIEYSAPEEVSVFVFKEADAAGQAGLENVDKNKAKALATKKGKGETFTVDVPENTATRIILAANKKTDVAVKITNK